jgi:uncharacterized protein (TIGR02099 family)
MRFWFRKLARGTSITLVVSALVVVLAVGGFHVLARRLPSYQDEIQAWVAAELGLALDYERLDATLGWRGPELAFREVSVRTVGDEAPFLTARGASVGFTTLELVSGLIARRPVTVDRLTFEGTELTLVRTESGYRLQGAPASSATSPSSVDVPPAIDVLVRDSSVLYLDAERSVAWGFQDVEGSLRRDDGVLVLEASARPPAEVAERIEIAAQAVVADETGGGAKFTGDWRLSANVAAADIAMAARLLPESAVVPRGGNGDIAVRLEWRAGELVSGTAGVSVRDVELQAATGGADSRYERVGFAGNWQRAPDGWRFAARDVAVTRNGRSWPMAGTVDIDVALEGEDIARFALRSTFARLEDLTPFLAPLPRSRLLDSWFALAPRGDLENVDLALGRDADGAVEYTGSGDFAGLGFAPFEGLPGVAGLTGQVRADSRAGRIELASTSARLDWPALFRQAFDVEALHGVVVWRAGQGAVRIVSDDLVVATADASLRTNLELTLPMDGASPELDLRTSVSGFSIAAVPRYLPANKMPETVVAWLDTALRGGRATGGEITFVGPVRAFPFDGGEGEFRASARVTEAELAFVSDWPTAQDLDGTVEFVNAGFAARGGGRVLGNRTDDMRVAIGDLRTGELTLQAATRGDLDQVLAFLNGAPLIAGYLGEDFSRLEALGGASAVGLDLYLPLREREAYRVSATLDIDGAELAYRGFGPHATEVSGRLTLADGVLSGTGIDAILLDGPIVASVDAAGVPGYRARIDVEGEVTIDAVVDAFALPYGELLAGQANWHGSLLIPAAAGAESLPARISVGSNLSGVALRFPEPFAKAPGVATNLELDMAFPEGGLTMAGNLGATRRFALEFDALADAEKPFRFRRAALEFGGALPEFRFDSGVTLDGELPRLRVDDWLALPSRADRDVARSDWSGALAGAELDVAEFQIFGQQLGSTRLSARRRTDDWQFEIDSDAIAGTVLVPADLESDPRVVAVMRRLYLNGGDDTASSELDPRDLPGLQLHADEFGVGQREIGRLDAEVLSDPLGLRLVSFESATESFTAQGSGGWFMDAEGATTRFAVSINSTDVGRMLEQLGVARFVEAQTAEVTASVYWPGSPSGAWLDHIGGDLALRVGKGSLVDVEPGGAGRAVGLLSISALPRRLALDFRDVFNRGLVFDDVTGDFLIVDGNAYTDNLKVTGPVAEVGIIGRTGLRDRDYHQQAIVTAEPGRILPTVGALLGGPQVAAALLIFTRIFKKPLRGIGSASYCVTGGWQEPKVERLTDEQVDQGALCAEMPPNAAASRASAEGESQ